jgi:TRAP-type C4-dicarboxylate transport system permease small subunit
VTPMSEKKTVNIARSMDRASKPLTIVAGISLLLLVVTIVASVIARYLFNSPIKGADELVQMSGVVLIMTALPYATSVGAHVRVDIFDALLGQWGRVFGDILSRLVSGFVLVIIAQRAWLRMFDAFEYADTTNMLQLPLWPFYGVLMAGTVFCIVIYVAELIQLIFTGKEI